MEKLQRKSTKPALDLIFEALYGKKYRLIDGYEETEFDDDDSDCEILSE